MKHYFIYLWTIWCAIWLAIIILLIFPPFVLIVYSGFNSRSRWANKLVSTGAKTLLFFWGIRVIQHNKQLIDPNRSYVFVSNHRSDLDGIITYAIMSGDFKFIGKTQILNWPFFGLLLRQLHITVDRSSPQSRNQSMIDMKDAIKNGASIQVFPEGWCNFSDQYVLPFKRGAFRIALETKTPMAVYTMTGNAELWPKTTLKIRPGTTHVYWEKIIETSQLNEEDEQVLQQEVRQTLEDRLKSVYPDGFRNESQKISFEEWQARQLDNKH